LESPRLVRRLVSFTGSKFTRFVGLGWRNDRFRFRFFRNHNLFICFLFLRRSRDDCLNSFPCFFIKFSSTQFIFAESVRKVDRHAFFKRLSFEFHYELLTLFICYDMVFVQSHATSFHRTRWIVTSRVCITTFVTYFIVVTQVDIKFINYKSITY